MIFYLMLKVYKITLNIHQPQRRLRWLGKNSSIRCAMASAPDIIVTRPKKAMFAGFSSISSFIINANLRKWENRKLPPFSLTWPPGKTSPHLPRIKPLMPYQCSQSRRIRRTQPTGCPEIEKAPSSPACERDCAFPTMQLLPWNPNLLMLQN